MARHISSEKARAHWREILDAVDGGEEIVIERYGRPVAVVAPYREITDNSSYLREPSPFYEEATIARLKAEIIADVVAELDIGPLEPIAWDVGIAELSRMAKAGPSPFADMTADEIVEKMRQTRREIIEADYAHLY